MCRRCRSVLWPGLRRRGRVAPKVTTLDNQTAKISQGTSIPFSQASAAGVNTTFIEARLSLEVTPHITQDGSVLLSINADKSEPDPGTTGANGQPAILRKQANTNVLVKDGDTTGPQSALTYASSGDRGSCMSGETLYALGYSPDSDGGLRDVVWVVDAMNVKPITTPKAMMRLICAADRLFMTSGGQPSDTPYYPRYENRLYTLGSDGGISDIDIGTRWGSNTQEFTQVGDRLYFVAEDLKYGRELRYLDLGDRRIQCPADVRVETHEAPVAVSWPNGTSSGLWDENPSWTFSPNSGSTFLVGVTNVEASVSDAHETVACRFKVEVVQSTVSGTDGGQSEPDGGQLEGDGGQPATDGGTMTDEKPRRGCGCTSTVKVLPLGLLLGLLLRRRGSGSRVPISGSRPHD